MTTFRIALANVPFPATPDASIALARAAIAEASAAGAGIVCFPESFVPGYRGLGMRVAAPDAGFLARAWSDIGAAAALARITVVLGTERLLDDGLRNSAMVFNPDGTIQGMQDKVQVDPSENATYTSGSGRILFHAGALTFGVAICHEGFRYPETVRWAARRGAHVVFHPHFMKTEPGAYQPSTFAHPANSFHEKAGLCRAAENTCFYATVNYASDGSPTTSAVIRPDGTVLCYQPYGKPGLLVADIDTGEATGVLATRLRAVEETEMAEIAEITRRS